MERDREIRVTYQKKLVEILAPVLVSVVKVLLGVLDLAHSYLVLVYRPTSEESGGEMIS